MYYKIDENGEKIFSKCGSILLNDIWISNPTAEMIAEAGWIEDITEEIPATLEEFKIHKIEESNDYANSLRKVNLYGVELWKTPAERDNYTSTLLSAKRLGQTEVSFMGITLSIDNAIHILDIVNVWAFRVTSVQEFHKNAINNLSTEEEVDNYDYTVGYPEQIIITNDEQI